jgi:putative transferase (TIGR04331 family)
MPWLVIGPDPELRISGEEMVLINEWARSESSTGDKHFHSIEVANFQIDSSMEISALIAHARALEVNLFQSLCQALNRYHGLDRSQRFWRMLLGSWLRRVVELYCFREFHILRCIEKYSINNIKILENADLIKETNYTIDILNLQKDIDWNTQVTSRIIREFRLPNVNLHEVKKNKVAVTSNYTQVESLDNQRKTSRVLKKLLKSLIKKFQKDHDAVILNTYLTRWREALLNLSFKQLPQFYDFYPEQKIKSKGICEAKSTLKSYLDYEDLQCSEILVDLILDLFPRCYLEDMFELQSLTNKQRLPDKPKFIFSSNDFDTNEIFKLWSANQVETGTPYFIGQHGNDYGTNLLESPLVEEEICDYFLTWGWMREAHHDVPCFNFKQPRKRRTSPGSKSLILFEKPLIINNLSWCGIDSSEKYRENQFTFLDNLESKVRDVTIVRLFQPHRDKIGNEFVRWQNFDSRIELDSQSRSIDLVQNSRLAVFSYDSTGMLERLSLNLPVVAFWENRFFHVHKEYLDLYEKLESVGIFHSTASQAGVFISQQWDNLDDWWFSTSVQEVVAEFSTRLCRNSESPVRDLKRTILGLLN